MKTPTQYLISAALAIGIIATANAQNPQPIALADGTVVPVTLSHSIDTAKAKPRDLITARTMQLVHAGNSIDVAQGSLVTGHIVSVTPYNESAGQSASLVLRFDHIQIGTKTMPVVFSVRAVASSSETYNAEYLTVPQSQSPYTHALIGGGRTTPGSKFLYSDNATRSDTRIVMADTAPCFQDLPKIQQGFSATARVHRKHSLFSLLALAESTALTT
ncbi:MAG TPA: hypothetical protein VGB94_09965 [Acidobacteriaceae bacterium]